MGVQTKFALSGFIGNTHDALIVFEACRRGILPRAQGRLSEAERKAIKSGDIYVFNEEESQIKRWTDGKRWSPSRILNNFLIYREVKSDEGDDEDGEDGQRTQAKAENEDVDELAPSTSAGPSTGRRPSNTPSLTSPSVNNAESSPSSRTVDPKLRNITGGLELLPNRKEGGLIKKTISVAGLHMISYYSVEDVLANRLRQPGSIPEIANIDISHPFLMAQFFRHPPQVTFDADQMPHFAGITDDEPMIRKPHVQQRRKREQSDQMTPSLVEASLLPVPGQGSSQQNASHNPPLLAPLPPRTSLSPIGPSHPYQTMDSPIQHAKQNFTSIASHMTTDMNPLLPPVRPGTGSRSSTGLSNASASDSSSSPRMRSTLQQTIRHEPYRIPSGRSRYSSIIDPTPSPHIENAQSPCSYPKQASLPNQGMDYYRNIGRQESSESFATPYSRSLEQHYPMSMATVPNNSSQDYRYTLAGPEAVHTPAWPMSNHGEISDNSQDYYSTMQSGQLATGEPPHNMTHPQASGSGPVYASEQAPQPTYSHPTLYAGPDFYSRTPVAMENNQGQARQWYGQGQEEYAMHGRTAASSHPNNAFPQQEHLIAPQAVQHLSGLLPQTGYSPLLPASAAYANELPTQEPMQHLDNGHQMKSEPYSPGKQSSYDQQQQSYITAPPPPSYTHPNQTFQGEHKVSPAEQEDIKPFSAYPYAQSGNYEASHMEDPRDS